MSDSIEFFPLYVIYHDQWGFRDWQWSQYHGWEPVCFHSHRGHCHFFMLGFDMEKGDSTKAYGGLQLYKFELEDIWSIRSKDVNKNDNVRILGEPKWFFEIEEYWRRVYIQPWESPKKKGIKYEASAPCHTFGPFREIRNGMDNSTPRKSSTNFFFFNNMSRTLPLEYFKNEAKTTRDHFIKRGDCVWNIDWEKPDINGNVFNRNGDTPYIIPKGFWCAGDPTGVEHPHQEAPSRRYGYPDHMYAYPTIEYQAVQQLIPTSSRPEGWEMLPDATGFSVTVEIPFIIDGEVQSPFSEGNGPTTPIGTYCNDFDKKHPDRVLRYPLVDYVDSLTTEVVTTTAMDEKKSLDFTDIALREISWGDGLSETITTIGTFEHTYSAIGTYTISILKKDTNPANDEWRIPNELKGKKVVWNIPDELNGKMDGLWVEQCLGGVVKAKALVTIEDNFGGVREVWITANNFLVDEKFSGMDQGEPK